MGFQTIPNGWKKVKLGEVVEILDSQRIPLSSLEREKRKGKYPYYGASGIIDYIDDYIFDGEYLLISEDGANLVERKTPIAFVAKGKFWVNNHAHIIKGRDGLSDLYYLLYLFQILDISGYITGTAQPKLSQKNLQNIDILLPPLPIQKKISSILSAYDDLIENNNKRIKLLESMAKAIFDDMMKQAEEKGEVEEVKLTEFCEIKYGKNLPKSKLISDGKYPVYGASKVIGYYNEYNVEDRTLIVGCRGTVGEVNITQPKSFVTNNSFILKCETYKKWYVYFYLKKRGFKDIIGGVAQPQITLSGMETIKIKIKTPKIEILKDFYNKVNPIFELIFNLQLQNQNLKQTRDLLIPRLVSGKLDVVELDIR